MRKILTSMLVLFAFAALTVGCAGNPCEEAANRIESKLNECDIDTSDGSDGSGSGECTAEQGEAAQCVADCTEAAECGAFDGSDPDAASDYNDCLVDCS